MIKIEITSVCARNGGEEICVSFLLHDGESGHECRESYIISSKQYLVAGPSKGLCDRELYEQVIYAAEIWSAVKKGMLVLRCAPSSERALCRKLFLKGFDKDIAAEAARELVSMGLICAKEDSARQAVLLSKKLWGKRRIIAELYAKGYDADTVAFAMNSLEHSGIDFNVSCAKLIAKKCGRAPLDATEKRKLVASLQRYGYSLDEIKTALNKRENDRI